MSKRLCTAHNARTRQPCRNPAMRGLDVCYQHGGKAPQVRNAAARRVEEAQAADRARRRLVKRNQVTDPIAELAELVDASRAQRIELEGQMAMRPEATAVLIAAWGAVVKLEGDLLERVIRYQPLGAELDREQGRQIADVVRAAVEVLPDDLRTQVLRRVAQAIRGERLDDTPLVQRQPASLPAARQDLAALPAPAPPIEHDPMPEPPVPEPPVPLDDQDGHHSAQDPEPSTEPGWVDQLAAASRAQDDAPDRREAAIWTGERGRFG